MKEIIYPRKLTASERTILFSILPDGKTGYKNYRSLIDKFYLIGEGRFGNGNLILGELDKLSDPFISSSSVFALGNIFTADEDYYIVIHSIDEGAIEIQIDPYPVNNEIVITKVVSYSDWVPGMKSPEKNSKVYQYLIKEKEYILAICPLSKKIWLHEYITGVNHIIPKSNFINELMQLQKVTKDKSLINPANFFENINKFSDNEIKLSFLLYNKYLKHFDLGDKLEKFLAENLKSKKSLKLFGRGLN